MNRRRLRSAAAPERTPTRVLVRAGPAIALGLAVVLLAAGCDRRTTPEADPQPFPMQASLSTNRIRIGESIVLRMEIEHPADHRIEWPSLRRDKELEPYDKPVLRTEPIAEDRARSTFKAPFRSWRIGQFDLGTNPVQIVEGSGDVIERPLPFVTYEVVSVLTNQTTAPEGSFLPEVGLQSWPDAIPGWLKVTALLAAAGGALAAGAWWLLRRRSEQAAPPPPRRPAHEIALNALDRLRRKGYIEAGRIEPFYIEVSSIVRHYLEERFQIHAPEQTTEEFIRAAAASAVLSTEHQSLCAGFLARCDQVKFARHEPGAREMNEALDSAVRLVQETRPPPAEEAA